MVESLKFDPSITSASLAFFSVAQAASRVFTGTLSESALTWNTKSFCINKGIPRPFFMVMASIVGFTAHFILSIARTEFIFVIGVTLSGIAFGMIWPLMVLISAEVFGVAGAGQNYMFYDGVSSAGGTLLITKFVAQAVYDHNTDPNGADSKTCIGMDCFQTTHMIVAGLCLSCVVSSTVMMYTSRHTYNKPILQSH
jgi:MFS family permease